ncbi:hypothetical protein CAPTEDRAFT_223031 [Capitella teleta]|uniref:Alpha-1,4-N-acetylglucosaminyltransferase n=1 Tax=Capitella teleta TaxID=283909 RepID=R7T8E7_CAPTE|nr:hypothetical protein CAPTEDRAFT_223031 [Capitella teleta]|eukprot:ELT89954.1 hypothetical protein CAPTEDRAFT_223031 [Capitella teleta]
MASGFRLLWRRISAPTIVIFVTSVLLLGWTFQMIHSSSLQRQEYAKLVETLRIRDANAHSRALDNIVISSDCKAISPVHSEEDEVADHEHKYRSISDDYIKGAIAEEVDFSRVLLHYGKSVLKVLSKKTHARKLSITSEMSTPNVVHYFWPKDKTFSFLSYLSLLSVEKFISPQYIVVHGTEVPTGTWWNKVLVNVPNILFMKKKLSWNFSGISIRSARVATSLARMETILDYGGIVLDPDVIVLKSFDAFRRVPFVAGRESPDRLSLSVMIGHRGAPFLRLLLEGYRSALLQEDAADLRDIPQSLAAIFPNLIHVEGKSFGLSIDNLPVLASIHVDWHHLNAIRLIEDADYRLPQHPEEIKLLDSTVGEIMRYIYYGDKHIA